MGPLIFRELKSCRKGHQIKGTAPVGVTSVCYHRDTIAAQSSSGGRVTPRGALGEGPRSETPHFTRTTTAHNSHSNVKSFAVLIRWFSSLSKAQRTQPTSQPITNGAGRVSPELQWDPQKETLGGTWLSVGPPAAPHSSCTGPHGHPSSTSMFNICYLRNLCIIEGDPAVRWLVVMVVLMNAVRDVVS